MKKITLAIIGVVALAFVIGVLIPTDNISNDTNSTTNPKYNQTQTPPINTTKTESINPPISFEQTVDNDSDSFETLNKNIPSGYVFGNLHNNGLRSGMGTLTMEDPQQKVGIRFTALYDGPVEEISLYLLNNLTDQVKVGIQRDDGTGKPDGKWIENSEMQERLETRLNVFHFNPGLNLEKGQIYHLIIEPSKTSEPFDPVSVMVFQSNFQGRPLNPLDPDIYFDDPFFSSMYYDGAKWIEEDRWPIFMLEYEDEKRDGQPYSLAAPWAIKDLIYVGQTLIPSSDYLVSKIGIVVGFEGNPSGPLYYGIKDSQNNLLATGQFTNKNSLVQFKNWKEVTLDEPILFSAGKLYRIFLFSPEATGDDIYQIYGHELSIDPNLGYGAKRHTLTISYDSGNTWAAWNDADVLFKITTSEN